MTKNLEIFLQKLQVGRITEKESMELNGGDVAQPMDEAFCVTFYFCTHPSNKKSCPVHVFCLGHSRCGDEMHTPSDVLVCDFI